ncbi:EXOSTOSIN HEPARAN SULFATE GLYCOSYLTRANSFERASE -RELATED [Salix purpurea]|uniref:EXOSTOSIN HEPARAN SULFATE GLYCOSYLTRANSFERASE -RELATED n=1 Tax=Salix purpurea TaxID=77065 RepID=A0A9Q0UJY3_SALPP|nr:EXOSTOSIN HEPARAN SULFATE GLYCOSYLTRANSFERASE -RELATED [Salix purpurea]
METSALFQRLCLVEIRRLLMVIGVAVVVIILFQCFALPYGKGWSVSPANEGSVVLLISNPILPNSSKSSIRVFNIMTNGSDSSDLGEEDEAEIADKDAEYELKSDKILQNDVMLKLGETLGKSSITVTDNTSSQEKSIETGSKQLKQDDENGILEATTSSTFGGIQSNAGTVPGLFLSISKKNGENRDRDSIASDSFFPTKVISLDHMVTQTKNAELLQTISVTLNNNSARDSISTLKRWERSTSMSQMNSLLIHSLVYSHSMRPQRLYVRDRELLSAKLEIENAPRVDNPPGLYAYAFRNISMFKRSYELMERILKVYVYKEGEKPIFHQSKMRGIYASEGWFMKLIEGNKKFVVRDPRKAHLFYLPFSPHMLRVAMFDRNSHNQKELAEFLKNYVDLVAKKYSFWNRTGGTDHFLVGCHDWASQLTRHHMRNCIRVLCNSNAAKGFKIGKDTTLPVTYIRSAENPLKELGGKPPSERPILAFFAGNMHGYARPILLEFWENKEPDMKILGPMSRDNAGKRRYREYMKRSKYCICARGYEVHTPRVVESIFYECVPVIISDNYVPPLFEVLNWEAFSVFIQEKDIPNLRNILLSIPEEKYVAMQMGVKKVQQHFLWHKKPVKYDLFHMILHSVWYNRVFQMESK